MTLRHGPPQLLLVWQAFKLLALVCLPVAFLYAFAVKAGAIGGAGAQETAATIANVTIAATAAHVLHEGTHYAFAWAFRREPDLGASIAKGMYVDHVAGEELTLEDWFIHAAPLVLGLTVGLYHLGRVGTVPPLWAVVGWAVYTLVGAPNDLRFRELGAETSA